MAYSPQELFAAGRYVAVKKAPYFSALILGLIPRDAPGLGTVGVTEHGLLMVDWDFIAQVGSAEPLAFVFIHEVMHLVLEHAKRRGHRDPKRWNVAGDISFNGEILAMGVQPPAGNLAPLLPATYGLDDGLTADEYYDLLPDDPGHGTAPGRGGCGGCSGNPNDGEPDDENVDGENGRTEAEMERIRRTVAEAVQEEAAKGCGNVPASLVRWAESELGPAKIPWEQKLAQAARMAVGWRTGAVDYRYDGPSRRQAGIGYGAGRPILPRLRLPVPHVAIAVDTSGSMGTDELSAALRESNGVLAAVGAEITYLACDADVHELRKVRDVHEMASALKGGGGTDFRPVFTALERVRPLPEVLVFITDGCGPAPASPPPRTKVIWVLVGPYQQRPCSWGVHIHVDGPDGDG